MKFTCTCGKTFQFSSKLAGKKARCRKCQRVFRIPELESPAKVVARIIADDELTLEPDRMVDEVAQAKKDLADARISLLDNERELKEALEQKVPEATRLSLERAVNDVGDAMRQVEDAARTFRQTEVTLAYWRDKISSASDEMDMLAKERDEIREELDDAAQDISDMRDELVIAKESKSVDAVELLEENNRLVEFCEVQQQKFTEANAEKETLQKSLMRSLQDMERANIQVQELKDIATSSKRVCAELEDQFRTELRDEQLRADRELQRTLAEKSGVQAELVETREKLHQSRKCMQELENELYASQAQQRLGKERLDKEVEQARNEVASVRAELSGTNKDLKRELERIEVMQQELSGTERKNSIFVADIERSREQVGMLEKRLQFAEDEVVAKQAAQLSAKDRFKKKIEEMHDERKKYEDRVIKMQNALKSAKVRQDQMKRDISSALKENIRLREELKKTEGEATESIRSRTHMSEILATALDQARQARRELDEAEGEIYTIRKQHRDVVEEKPEIDDTPKTEEFTTKAPVEEESQLTHESTFALTENEQDLDTEFRRAFGEDLCEELQAAPTVYRPRARWRVSKFTAVIGLIIITALAVTAIKYSRTSDIPTIATNDQSIRQTMDNIAGSIDTNISACVDDNSPLPQRNEIKLSVDNTPVAAVGNKLGGSKVIRARVELPPLPEIDD